MPRAFHRDPFPGKLRILFVGLAESSHTHAWIDLLENAELNVRLFALPSGAPPDEWRVRTYVSGRPPIRYDTHLRNCLYSLGRSEQLVARGIARYVLHKDQAFEERWLARIIRSWKPHVIHTLGLAPASYFYARARARYRLQGLGKWVVQARGGPDLALHRLVPEHSTSIAQILRDCDCLVADNQLNLEYAVALGLRPDKVASLGIVPGTGGVDVAGLSAMSTESPSRRGRTVLFPKAYECPQSTALPVLEAIRLAWNNIQPCHIVMLASIPETRMWVETLPPEIRASCSVHGRIPRNEALGLLTQARVCVAPSLSDGTPNNLLEAMATGAFPIVSPLETITPIVRNETNVLFARNLYPDEIAGALVRAMTDDDLVDRAARNNLELVRRIADRATIRPRVVEFYLQLGASRRMITAQRG